VAKVTKAFQSLADSATQGIKQPLSSFADVSERVPATVFDTFRKLMNPQHSIDVATDFAQRSMNAARSSMLPANIATAIEEIRNKSEVLFFVTQNRRILNIPSPAPVPFPLPELVEKCYDRRDFPALWTIEDLGHAYGNSFFDRNIEPSGILKEDMEATLPAKSLTILHAGIGLSFANKLLRGADSNTPKSELKDAIDRFVTLCHENSQKGYEGAALESVGLVVRTWHSDLVSAIDGILEASDSAEELRGYFWHGVGRALYFLPINFLPFSDWQIFETVQREAPKEYLNSALAGVAWAFVLVNNKSPQVLSPTCSWWNMARTWRKNPDSSMASSQP
jgi:hypothetical protein